MKNGNSCSKKWNYRKTKVMVYALLIKFQGHILMCWYEEQAIFNQNGHVKKIATKWPSCAKRQEQKEAFFELITFCVLKEIKTLVTKCLLEQIHVVERSEMRNVAYFEWTSRHTWNHGEKKKHLAKFNDKDEETLLLKAKRHEFKSSSTWLVCQSPFF